MIMNPAVNNIITELLYELKEVARLSTAEAR